MNKAEKYWFQDREQSMQKGDFLGITLNKENYKNEISNNEMHENNMNFEEIAQTKQISYWRQMFSLDRVTRGQKSKIQNVSRRQRWIKIQGQL